MKQLLLRVPEALHQRLSARAAREGRSMNSVATEILDTATDADLSDRRARVRAKAAALGMLVEPAAASRVSAGRRKRILASTRGLGPQADRLIREQRERF
ncbi:MAG: toxin-antitoxin system HicB family antitoxin [Actinobacteria bacterium]|nr:toxin-antitoxin system HicB family antitoxin [Actinomycetota bacterium]